MLKTVQDGAGRRFEFDQDMKYEIHEKLSVKAQSVTEASSVLAGSRLTKFTDTGDVHRKRSNPIE